jgi:16S rRNA (uracil1498-N3)-methyltransferase
MKIHRFYISEQLPTPSATTILPFTLSSSELYNQMNRVLRLRISETVILFNGDGFEYVSTIVSYPKKNVIEFEIVEKKPNNSAPKRELTVFFSLIKKDNIELILQKGTELGVTHFVPILSNRSEKKGINLERAEKILVEATEQCGRGVPPTIEEVVHIKDVLKDTGVPMIVFESGTQAFSATEFNSTNKLGILIGPEGGWTPEEIEFFEHKKAAFRSLGNTVLRAETAAIVASAFLLA